VFTVKEVAEQLSVSATCVYQLIAQGKLASHRFGAGRGTIRITAEDLIAYMEGSRRGEKTMRSISPPVTGGHKRFKHLSVDG
jgi:excisionase family DNA binding protein